MYGCNVKCQLFDIRMYNVAVWFEFRVQSVDKKMKVFESSFIRSARIHWMDGAWSWTSAVITSHCDPTFSFFLSPSLALYIYIYVWMLVSCTIVLQCELNPIVNCSAFTEEPQGNKFLKLPLVSWPFLYIYGPLRLYILSSCTNHIHISTYMHNMYGI